MDSEDLDDSSKQFSDDMSDDETLNEGVIDGLEARERISFQKEIHDLKLLPYADQLDSEADEMFAKIKYNLGRYTMLRKIDNISESWLDLLKYIKMYHLRFSKEDHIAFIKVMYKFMTIPDLESGPVCSAGYTLIVLLRKTDLISPKELELPWRPLYELCKNTVSYAPHQVRIKHESGSLKAILEKVINLAKVYFPPNATQEILDEFKPGIFVFTYSTTRRAAKLFEWFLPVLLTPDRHEQGYKLWFDEFMILWKNCTLTPIASSLMHIFSDLAYYNVGYIDWEPYIPLMFTKFVQSFNLPVNYKSLYSKSGVKISPRLIGIWIASVLGGNSSAQLYLDKFLKTVETYFHPANFGTWLKNLEELFATLANTIVIRLYRERYQKFKKNNPKWKAPTPDSHKLTDADVDAFINSMMQIVTTGIFNKRCHALFEALSYLAIIRPNIVIPVVLEKVYPTLGDEIEPHKQITAFNSLIAISRPLVLGSRHVEKDYAFEEGPLYVLPLLFSSLAGIDPNDQTRCLATFRLIQVYLSIIPIVDCSKLSVDMSDDERLVCEETSRFEDFVLQLMDKVFALIESSTFESVRLESTRSTIKSQSHSRIEMDLNFLFLTLLRQSSHSIFLSALSKLRSFILGSTFEIQVSGRLVGALCEVFAQVNGPETLKALLPFISERFHESVDEDDAIKAEHLNNEVLYPLLLLSRLVLTQGDVLLPHEDTVLSIIDKAIRLKSLEGNDLGCLLLTNMLQAFVHLNPINVVRNLEDREYPYMRDWGTPVKIKSVKYYVPSDREVTVMQRIFERYFIPAVAKIEEFIKTGNSLSRGELERTLRIISHIMKGCNGFLPIWSEPALEIKHFVKNDMTEPTLGYTGKITMPDGSNVRYFLVQLMSRLQEVMLTKVEDDTKSFLQLQMIWQNILFNKIDVESGFKYLKNFNTPFPIVKNKMVGCKGWFVTYALARLFTLHNSRRQFLTCSYTETHRKVFSNLFKLSISRYPGVRMKAQDILLCSPIYYPEYYVLLMPDIVEVLQRDPTDNHEAFKGILNLLTQQKTELDSLVCTRDWDFIRTIWPALAASGSSEKPSIVRLKKTVAEVIRDCFYSYTITMKISDDCVSAAEEFWNTGMKLTKPPPDRNEIELGVKELREYGEHNLKMYNETIDELVQVLAEKSKRWSDRVMSINFLFVLINEEVIVPTSLVRFCLNLLVNELIHERTAGIYLLLVITKQLKKKHPKIKIENPSISEYSSMPRPIKPGSRADNAWLQYNYDTRPTNQEAWDESRYLHKSFIGYYAWPRELEVYAPSSEQPKFDKSALTEQDLEIVRFFDNQQNVDKFVGYLSLEGKKVLEKFNEERRLVFNGLFRNYGDVFLPRFLPHLRRLVTEKQNTSQRCAAEIIAGIIQGSKHWTYDMVERMWKELLPILREALSNLSGESIGHWQHCMLRSCTNRDPNRLYWLFEFLLDELPKEQSAEASIVQFGRIMMFHTAIAPVGWKSIRLLRRMLEYLESRINQRIFRTVRDALVTTLNYILNENLELADMSDVPNNGKFLDKYYPSFQSLLEKNHAKTQGVSTTCMVSSTSSSESSAACTNCKDYPKTSESLTVSMDSNISFNESSVNCTCGAKESLEFNGVDVERENTIRLFKTICMLMFCVVRTTNKKHLSNFYKMLPLICQLENDEKDEELSKICTQTIAALAVTLHHPEHIPAALESVRLVCQSDSWSSRANCIEFLQVLVLHNMSFFLSNEVWIRDVQDIVIRCLEDERIEVREKAAKLLGGLLHCSVIPDQEVLLEEFKRKARKKLNKKKRVANDREDSTKIAQSIDAIRFRHASVLGMCAFITAYPYDIPKHVPPVFECLSFHLNDPEPIPSTIHKTVNEFKRTHCDGWTGLQGLAAKFTEEQFAVLQDLTVPPSYYA